MQRSARAISVPIAGVNKVHSFIATPIRSSCRREKIFHEMEALSAFSLPPGFGFHPTDVELVSHYLKRKLLGLKIDYEVIPEVDIYKHEPWDLPARCNVPTRDCKWHFFASRDKKYPNGSRSNRATEAGYWKSTGKDRNIRSHNRVIGTKKTLVFHEGRPPCGKRTEWIMHEFYINENECKAAPNMKDAYVLCRVTKRNGLALEGGENVPLQTDEIDNSPNQPKDKACREQYSSPSDKVADIEAMLMELTDPKATIPTLTEDKAEFSSPDLKQEVVDPSYPEVSEAPYLLSPVDDFYSILQSESHNFDIFGELDIGSLDSLGDTFPFMENHHDVFYSDNLETTYNNDTDAAEIQLRERLVKPGSAMPRHRIKLQVSKMEARNGKSLSKTVEIIDQGVHLDIYNAKQLVMDPKILSDASRAKMTTKTSNSRQSSVRSLRNSGGTSWFQGIREKLPNFLGRCSSVSINCFLLSGCMMGTVALISYFMI